MKISSFANRANAELIDTYYEQWRRNPAEMGADWRAFFEGFELARGKNGAAVRTPESTAKEAKVASLIYAYRSLGHNAAHLDPLGLRQLDYPKLRLKEFGLGEKDLSSQFSYSHYLKGKELTLREIVDNLEQTYCG